MERGRGGRGGQHGGRGGSRGGQRGGFSQSNGGRGGRGGNDRGNRRGGGQRGGQRGGNRSGGQSQKQEVKISVDQFRDFEGVYLCESKGNMLLTKNLAPGKSVYGEKLVKVDTENGQVEYREWNPYRSKIGAYILASGDGDSMGIKPGATVLYLGASCGTTVSHVSDIVGMSGRVYAVEFSHRVARELVTMAKNRPNIVPIIEDARKPQKYRMLVPMVDCLFADLAQPDQSRIFQLNAEYFLKSGGFFMISIKANCISSTTPAKEVFETEKNSLIEAGFSPTEEVDINEYHRNHEVVLGYYRK